MIMNRTWRRCWQEGELRRRHRWRRWHRQWWLWSSASRPARHSFVHLLRPPHCSSPPDPLTGCSCHAAASEISWGLGGSWVVLKVILVAGWTGCYMIKLGTTGKKLLKKKWSTRLTFSLTLFFDHLKIKFSREKYQEQGNMMTTHITHANRVKY